MEGLQQRKKFKFDLGLTCAKYTLLALNFVFIFECCGNESPNDWMNFGRFSTPYYYATVPWNYYNKQNDYYYDPTTTTTTTTTEAARTNMMPVSCCQPYSNYNNLQCERHYENGCFAYIHQVISESIMLIGSSALVFAVVQIVGIVLGFMYARIVRRNKTQRDVLVWNSQSTSCTRPVYADYTPIDNTDEVKHI